MSEWELLFSVTVKDPLFKSWMQREIAKHTGRLAVIEEAVDADMAEDRLLVEQACPSCGHFMPSVAGRKDAVCSRCGYKEPCC
ncbi:MAG: hypothetical protein KGL39_48095 [Patescibacteria group bacterium]|nr:hypothetical protein [Patescibacteria group bacterium]